MCDTLQTIIIVDDDDDDKGLIKFAFSKTCKHLDLILLSDGAELLQYLEDRKTRDPCLILLDLNMPRVSGIEALQRIRSDNRFTNIPIIVFTTTDEDTAVMKSYCSGATSFIQKPENLHSLLWIINQIAIYWCEVVKLPCRIGCNDLDYQRAA